jgi:hypothetical protein
MECYLVENLKELDQVASLKGLNVKRINEGYRTKVGPGLKEYLYIKKDMLERDYVIYAISAKRKILYWFRKDISKVAMIDYLKKDNIKILPIPSLTGQLFNNLDLILNKLEEIV